MSESPEEISQKSKITVEVVQVTLEQVKEYIDKTREKNNGEPPSRESLNDYLSSLNEHKDKIIIADLSNMSFDGDENKDSKKFGQTKPDYFLDLRGADFSGSILRNTKFNEVDLTDVSFRENDLENTSFINSNLNNVDFRGTDLSNTKFDEGYKDVGKLNRGFYVEGIKYSATRDLVRIYANIKAEAYKAQEASSIKKENPITETLSYVFSSQSSTFDPMYSRGSKAADRDKKKFLFKLERDDVEEYLARITDPDYRNLSLNDFAKDIAEKTGALQKAVDKGLVDKTTEVVASFSGLLNEKNEWVETTDLSNLKFNDANLDRVNFASVDLKGCEFNNAKLNKTNFESANLEQAKFTTGTQVTHSNFFNAKMKEVKISDSNFEGSYLPRSEGMDIEIKNSIFNHTNIEKAKWDRAKFTDVEANYINLSETVLCSAELRKFQMNYAILNNTRLDGTPEKQTVMDSVISYGATGSGTNISNVIARNCEIIDGKFDEIIAGNTIFDKGSLKGTDINFTSGSVGIVETDMQNVAMNGKAYVYVENSNVNNMNVCNLEKFEHKNCKGNVILNANTEANEIKDDIKQQENKVNYEFVNEKGEFIENRTPEQHEKIQKEKDVYAKTDGLSIMVGSFLKGAGKVLTKTAEFINKPFGKKTGIAIGVVVGCVVAAGIAAAIVATGGTALVAIGGVGLLAGVAGGCVIGGMAIGGLCGGIIAKRGGICGVASAVAGTLAAGPIGTAIGVAGYFVANTVAKKITGKGLDELLSKGVMTAGKATTAAGTYIDPTTAAGKREYEMQQECKKQHESDQQTKKANKQHKAAVNKVTYQVITAKNMEINDKKQEEEKKQNIVSKIKKVPEELLGDVKQVINVPLEKFKTKTGMARNK